MSPPRDVSQKPAGPVIVAKLVIPKAISTHLRSIFKAYCFGIINRCLEPLREISSSLLIGSC